MADTPALTPGWRLPASGVGCTKRFILDTDPLPTPFTGVNLLILLSAAIEFNAPANWLAWSVIILIALCCLFMSAFVSGSEIAYFGLRPQDLDSLRDSEDPHALQALSLLKNSEKLLATILIANNLVNITLVVLLTFAINQTVKFNSTLLNFLLQTVFLTFLLLLFGEIFPKLVARGRTMRWVLSTTGGISLLCRVLSPISSVMVKSTLIVNRIVRKKEETISAGELEKALEISDLSEGQEKDMLEGILSFGEKDASDIMIPRIDVTDIEYHDSWGQAMKVILDSGYSRIPVYDTSQDTIRGILYAKDLLPYIGKNDSSFRWQTLIRKAYFVPESRSLDDLLEDFRTKKIHIAIVVDEYGGTQGIVTLEDVIEEILGDIDDEYDQESKLYRQIGPDSWIFDARISLGDFFHAVGIEESEFGDVGEAETLAGLVLEIKGDFPALRESLSRGGLRFTVLKMERHRILKVKVEKINKQA